MKDATISAAYSALRSYQYGNASTDLAKSVADTMEVEMKAKPTLEDRQLWVAKARAAMQDFVDKCDRGEARSVRSYAAFKELLK